MTSWFSFIPIDCASAKRVGTNPPRLLAVCVQSSTIFIVKKPRVLLARTAFLLAIVGLVVAVYPGQAPWNRGTEKIATVELLPVMESCIGLPTAQRCLQDAFDALQGKMGTEALVNQLFQYRQAEPRATEYCHEIALALGRASLAEFKDPMKALAAGTPVCASGYIHGLQEAIGEDHVIPTEKLISSIEAMCSSLPIETFRVCYHGAGHAVNKRVGQDIQNGFSMCSQFSDEPQKIIGDATNYDAMYSPRELCAEGVTMRYFEPLADSVVVALPSVKDLAKAKGEIENPFSVCDAQTDSFLRWGCFEYASRAFHHNVASYTRIVDFCNLYGHDDQLPCFFGLSRELAYTPGTDSKHSLQTYCLKALDPDAAYFCGQNVLLNRITITGDYVTPVEICDSLPHSDIVTRICRRVATQSRPNENESSRGF